ncbi:MAG: hypothetical protein K0U61_09630 [Alphaproteobacteria bacterium]|nr:hypothetical protein [Alphaproteobacteria bacterium]
MKFAIPDFIQGWIWWGIIAALSYALLGPKIETILMANRIAAEKAELVVGYEARLDQPLSADRSLPYRSYVLAIGADVDAISNVQTGLLDLIRQNQARLIDLRETPTSARLGSLSALMYRVELEGDLQAVLETLSALGTSNYPLLIDRLELRPLERADRPDRLVRMTANLTVWTGDI